MISTDVFDHFLMKYFEFKEAKRFNPQLQNSTIRFDAAKERRLNKVLLNHFRHQPRVIFQINKTKHLLCSIFHLGLQCNHYQRGKITSKNMKENVRQGKFLGTVHRGRDPGLMEGLFCAQLKIQNSR